MTIDEKLLKESKGYIKIGKSPKNINYCRIDHPILTQVIKQRVYTNNFEINYHDDNLCGYTCHSDHGDDS